MSSIVQECIVELMLSFMTVKTSILHGTWHQFSTLKVCVDSHEEPKIFMAMVFFSGGSCKPLTRGLAKLELGSVRRCS
jgi:hypothetical protein